MSVYKSLANASLRKEHIDQELTLSGWVLRRRDHGGVIFVDLRDRSGFCQVVFRPETSKEAHDLADRLRSEFVIRVVGKVIAREAMNINPDMATGEVEVDVLKLEILSEAKTPVFSLDSKENIEVNEEIRLKHRYLDLRRDELKNNLLARHRFSQAVRNELDKNDFLDIETPILNKATPEGARDFIVPSRLNPGNFYALPQSPQIFKQILMVGGMERYYQIVKCFRDEDLRKDRQPEFTQIDIETAFLSQEELMELIEKTILNAMKSSFPKAAIPEEKVKRMTYAEAMQTYGSDRPDTRFDMKLIDVEAAVKNCEFKVFNTVLENKGLIRAICVKNGKELSRKDIDEATKYVAQFGARGLAWMRVTENGLESNIVKFFPEASQKALLETTGAEAGDLLLFVADSKEVTYQALGNLRLELAKKLNLLDDNILHFLWITDFPLMEYDAKEKRYFAVHHPFTAPKEEDLDKLESDPQSVRSQAYDFVLNGVELGGGSIRIHAAPLQNKIFKLLGIEEEEAKEKFGFLLDALSYGAPPHGGVAFGLDRILMLMQQCDSIRDVIAFPKTQRGQCLMSESPSAVPTESTEELYIQVQKDRLEK